MECCAYLLNSFKTRQMSAESKERPIPTPKTVGTSVSSKLSRTLKKKKLHNCIPHIFVAVYRGKVPKAFSAENKYKSNKWLYFSRSISSASHLVQRNIFFFFYLKRIFVCLCYHLRYDTLLYRHISNNT